MSEPSLIYSAPALAESAQQIALYSHYAVAVAGLGVGGFLISRTREQEKLPHILGAVAAIGMGLTALFSQWEFNQYLYLCRESAWNAVMLRPSLWAVWASLILVGLAFTPGFRFKRMKKLALVPLIALAVISFGLSAAGEIIVAQKTTTLPAIAALDSVGNDLATYFELEKVAARTTVYAFAIPALVCALGVIGVFIFTQQKKVEKRSQENHQARTGVMTLVALSIPAIAYAAGMFVAVSARGVSGSVLLFNCAEVMSMFFLFCATMSLVGVPANFPKPVVPKKEKKPAPAAAPAAEAQPTPLDQQQAYAQYYAQQQAYAQYYAQLQAQQAAAAQAAQQQAPAPQQQPVAQPGAPVDPAVAAAYQQQAQYYAQQQAYAAYQQQQQAYQQAYAAQQQYAQPQQQVYAQAYAQQQNAYQQQQRATAPAAGGVHRGVKKVGVGAPAPRPAASSGVKKIGGVRPVKKIH